uniref:G_PROTEIN_RECEP_F1_2 domain-containing protein n=2 Tax=Caenorhabditis tropicalis TaxID=1561998 RepID=A0A1I7T328_9PELO
MLFQKMFPGDGEILLRSRLYVMCGIFVLIPNTICLVVFNSSKDFRQRFVFFTLLSVSDMINGISFIMSGSGRLNLILHDQYHFKTSSYECMTGYLWPVFLLFGGQLPATFHCLLTVERVLAVNRVSWYRSRWTWRHRLYLSSLGIFICVFLSFIALIVSFASPSLNDNRICAVMDSTGIVYGTIHYCWIALSYMIAFGVTLNLFLRSHGSKFLNHTEKRKQMAILILSGINVLMVSVPNFVLVADQWDTDEFDVLLVGVAYLLYGFQSCFNLPIFYFFRLEFRRRCHELCRFRRTGSNTIVSNDMSRQKLSRVNASFVNTAI